MLRTNTVPILEVLDKLWYSYFEKWNNEYGIYEWTTKTDWWSANSEKNRVTDFSENWRPEWEARGVVKMHHNYTDDQDIFKWFAENFPSYNTWKEAKKPVKKIREELHNLSEKQQAYLLSRWIEYQKVQEYVKDYNWAIGCMVYVWITPVGINARRIDWGSVRFTALAWYETNGIYYWWLDKTKDYVIVVEWLIDFLTLKQYETNVVWLKAINSWFDEIIKLAKTYKIKMVFDNDGKEEQAKKKLQSIKYSFFNWDIVTENWFTAKDANDLHEIIKEDTITIILDNQIEQTPILWTIERYRERQEIIKARWKLGDDWPYPIIYDYTQGIVRWKVYTIGAFSNVGKSKFWYSHVPFFLKQWKKVLYLSLEENELDIFTNIACPMYNHRISDQGNMKVKVSDFENLICIDNCNTLSEIQDIVKLHSPDIVFIDYIQAIFEKWSQYEKGALVALWIQKMAIENNCTIFSMSQLSNTSMSDVNKDLKESTILLKGAWEYYAASDVIMILSRATDGRMLLKLEKNKLWRRGMIWSMHVWWDTNIFGDIDDVTHMMWWQQNNW